MPLGCCAMAGTMPRTNQPVQYRSLVHRFTNSALYFKRPLPHGRGSDWIVRKHAAGLFHSFSRARWAD